MIAGPLSFVIMILILKHRFGQSKNNSYFAIFDMDVAKD